MGHRRPTKQEYLDHPAWPANIGTEQRLALRSYWRPEAAGTAPERSSCLPGCLAAAAIMFGLGLLGPGLRGLPDPDALPALISACVLLLVAAVYLALRLRRGLRFRALSRPALQPALESHRLVAGLPWQIQCLVRLDRLPPHRRAEFETQLLDRTLDFPEREIFHHVDDFEEELDKPLEAEESLLARPDFLQFCATWGGDPAEIVQDCEDFPMHELLRRSYPGGNWPSTLDREAWASFQQYAAAQGQSRQGILEHPLWPAALDSTARRQLAQLATRLDWYCNLIELLTLALVVIGLFAPAMLLQQCGNFYLEFRPFDEPFDAGLLRFAGFFCLLWLGLFGLYRLVQLHLRRRFGALRELQQLFAGLPWELRSAILFPRRLIHSEHALFSAVRAREERYQRPTLWPQTDPSDSVSAADQHDPDDEFDAAEQRRLLLVLDQGASWLPPLEMDKYPLWQGRYLFCLRMPLLEFWASAAVFLGLVVMMMSRFGDMEIGDAGGYIWGLAAIATMLGVLALGVTLQTSRAQAQPIPFVGHLGSYVLIAMGLLGIFISAVIPFRVSSSTLGLILLGWYGFKFLLLPLILRRRTR